VVFEKVQPLWRSSIRSKEEGDDVNNRKIID